MAVLQRRLGQHDLDAVAVAGLATSPMTRMMRPSVREEHRERLADQAETAAELVARSAGRIMPRS